MRIECKECGCTPKPDEWAYEGSDYCYDCSPLSSLGELWQKSPSINQRDLPLLESCSACNGNGYQRKNMVEIHQCKKCKSRGELYA